MENQPLDTFEAIRNFKEKKKQEIFENFKVTGGIDLKEMLDQMHELQEIVEGLREDVRAKINNILN